MKRIPGLMTATPVNLSSINSKKYKTMFKSSCGVKK
jgi:hypothetical protein